MECALRCSKDRQSQQQCFRPRKS